MFAVVYFAAYVNQPNPTAPFEGIRIFATLAEARAYQTGQLDAHDLDDDPYTVQIYDRNGRFVTDEYREGS